MSSTPSGYNVGSDGAPGTGAPTLAAYRMPAGVDRLPESKDNPLHATRLPQMNGGLMRPKTFPAPATCTRWRRSTAALLAVLIAVGVAQPIRAEAPAPAVKVPTSWQDAERLTIEELAKLLKSTAERPAMFHTGFRVLFVQAHIPGSQFAGPGANQTGLDALRKAVAALPKTKPIVLYCGCCPWERCPNLEQPWRLLVAAGFTNVKILFIPTNFGRDWVQKGYPSESGDAGRG